MSFQKRCSHCKEIKDISNFTIDRKRKDGLDKWCKTCHSNHDKQPDVLAKTRRRKRNWRHATHRCRPMAEAKDSASYLGVHISEHVLSNFFDHVKRMPLNNPGYDFICGRGYKIDAKSSCLQHPGDSVPAWRFSIRKNKIADYFVCLAFDNREDLRPQHIWVIPAAAVNNFDTLRITDNCCVA